MRPRRSSTWPVARRSIRRACCVIGHSVGGTIAIRLAARPRPLAGVVLLACSTQNGEEVMRDQTERIAATLRGLQRLGAGRLRRRQAEAREQLLSSSEDVVRIQGQDQPALWLREFMRYDPALDLPRIACPVLAVTGGDDVQVDPAEVERMRGLVTAPFTGANPAGLSHLLRMSSGPPGLAGYPKQLERPVDEALLDLVGTWAAEVDRIARPVAQEHDARVERLRADELEAHLLELRPVARAPRGRVDPEPQLVHEPGLDELPRDVAAAPRDEIAVERVLDASRRIRPGLPRAASRSSPAAPRASGRRRTSASGSAGRPTGRADPTNSREAPRSSCGR